MVATATDVCRRYLKTAGVQIGHGVDYATEYVVRGIRWCERSEF